MDYKIIRDFKIRSYGPREMTAELKRTQALVETLITKILYSKRLLVDHVECLEQCIRQLPDINILPDINSTVGKQADNVGKPVEIFTARHTCLLLGTTVIEHLITPKYLRITLLPSILLVSTFSALYAVKNIFKFRNKLVERELSKIIRSIDDFGNCIRRNITYFNEILIMKQQELIESRQIERAWDCITAAKEVIEILYDATRKLETQYPLPARFSPYYSPMEELRDCEYFKNNVTNYSPKHIKDFYNIFAYVQSQFLLRLAFTIITKPPISQLSFELEKINSLIHQLVQEEENHFMNLTVEMDKKKELTTDSLANQKVMHNFSGPMAVLKDSSLKLSARMVAVAAECQALDITLQRLNEIEEKDNGKQLAQVANNMHAIEHTLSVCFNDFQRLMLVYSKFLSSKLEGKSGEKGSKEESQSDSGESEFPESFLRVEISSHDGDDADRGDDFYAYMFDEQQEKVVLDDEKEDKSKRSGNGDLEILNFEKRITKGKFRPVLKQLKERLNPIRQEMLEKERLVLSAKGINVDKLFGKEHHSEEAKDTKNVKCIRFHLPTKSDNRMTSMEEHESDSENSIGSADLEFERQSKKLKERDNFEEMRNFLAQKQRINPFKLDIPPPESVAGNEEVLESEC